METETKVARMTLGKTWSGTVLTIAFQNRDADGKVIGEAAPPLVFDMAKASAECRARAERHGWEQRLGDRAAISKDTKTGKSATVEEKRSAVAELVDYYQTGAESWELKGAPRKPLTDEEKKALALDILAKLGLTVEIK